MNINSPSFTQGGGTDLKIPEVTEYILTPKHNELINFNGQLTRYDASTLSWIPVTQSLTSEYSFTVTGTHGRGLLRNGTAEPGTGEGHTTYDYEPLKLRGIYFSSNPDGSLRSSLMLYSTENGYKFSSADVVAMRLNNEVTLYTDPSPDQLPVVVAHYPTYGLTYFVWNVPTEGYTLHSDVTNNATIDVTLYFPEET